MKLSSKYVVGNPISANLRHLIFKIFRGAADPLAEQKFRNPLHTSHQCRRELNFPGIRWLLITSRDKLTFYDSFCDFQQPPIEFHYFTSSLFYLCSSVLYLCSLVFCLCSLVFHLCSTCVPLVSTCVHLCSTCVHLCSSVF